MKGGEIVRIIAFSLIGALVMLLLQPLIYQNRWVRMGDVPSVERWVSSDYMTSAGLVLAIAIVATIIWYFLTATAKVQGAVDTFRWRLMWFLLSLCPIIAIIISVFFINSSEDARLSLLGLFVLDIIFIYWGATVTSSPGSFKYIPPGSFLIRNTLGF